MRQLIILALLPFTLAGVTSGQEAGLPSCNAAQLGATDEYMIEIYELMGLALTPEMVAALSRAVYAEFGDLVTNETSSQTLSAYGEALFAWRKSFWEAHPICDEVFDIGLAMDESASDMAAFLAFQLAGVAIEDNPYVESMKDGIGLFSILMGEMTDKAPADGDLSEVDLRACSDDDLEILSQELAVYRALLEVPPRTYSLVGLAKYGVAQLTWRDKLWTRLPPCELSLQVGLLMSHITSDLAIELALKIGVIASEDAPFSDQIVAYQARLHELIESIEPDYVGLAQAQSYLKTLPACTDDEQFGFVLVTFILSEPKNADLMNAVAESESVEDLLAVAETHIQWRTNLAERLEACADNIEIALMAYQATSAYITASALSFAGLAPEDNLHLTVVAELFPVLEEKNSRVTHNVFGAMAASAGKNEEAEKEPPRDLTLPECEGGNLGLNFYNAFVQYDNVRQRALAVETAGDIVAYNSAQVDWSRRFLPILPGCKEGLEAGLLMYTILSDYAAAYAFIIAGASVERIPYARALETNQDQLNAWLEEELG